MASIEMFKVAKDNTNILSRLLKCVSEVPASLESKSVPSPC
jgi:hypothetical protein